MTYPPELYGDAGPDPVTATLRRATHPPELAMAAGGSASFLATGASTAGRYGLFRWDMGERPGGPAPHFHRTMSEAFFVLSGTVALYDGARWVDAAPGDFLFVPPGGAHAFRNSGGVASMLILFAPGGPREAYFSELAEIAATGRQLSAPEWTALYARHDQYML